MILHKCPMRCLPASTQLALMFLGLLILPLSAKAQVTAEPARPPELRVEVQPAKPPELSVEAQPVSRTIGGSGSRQ